MSNKEPRTIKSILELVSNYGANEFIHSPKRPQLTIDQALLEIQELIDEAKPDYSNDTNGYEAGFNQAIDEYQDNLKKIIK